MIHPLAKGGINDLSNLHMLCQRCNLGKGDRLFVLDALPRWQICLLY